MHPAKIAGIGAALVATLSLWAGRQAQAGLLTFNVDNTTSYTYDFLTRSSSNPLLADYDVNISFDVDHGNYTGTQTSNYSSSSYSYNYTYSSLFLSNISIRGDDAFISALGLNDLGAYSQSQYIQLYSYFIEYTSGPYSDYGYYYLAIGQNAYASNPSVSSPSFDYFSASSSFQLSLGQVTSAAGVTNITRDTLLNVLATAANDGSLFSASTSGQRAAGTHRYDASGNYLGTSYTRYDQVSYGSQAQVAVPEPGTLALLGVGLVAVGFAARRR